MFISGLGLTRSALFLVYKQIFFVHKSIFFNINVLFVTENVHVQVAYYSVNNSPSAEHPENRKRFILRQAVPMLKAWSFGIGSDSVNTVIEFLLS